MSAIGRPMPASKRWRRRRIPPSLPVAINENDTARVLLLRCYNCEQRD